MWKVQITCRKQNTKTNIQDYNTNSNTHTTKYKHFRSESH